MSSFYEYLPVSAPEAQRAWHDFLSSKPRPTGRSVTFIPALGGSFVVLNAEERRSWLKALRDGPDQPRDVLQSFRRFLMPEKHDRVPRAHKDIHIVARR